MDNATSAYRTATDPLERFLQEACVFGPELRVTKSDMYKAYEEWCVDEDEEPKGSKTFTSLMNDKGVVKNFYGTKVKSQRIWKGVSLQENTPGDGLGDTSSNGQKSCKQMGGETSGGHFEEKSEDFPLDVPREERFSENGHEVSPTSRSVPHGFTTPHSWEEDGMEIEYMPEGE